MTFRQNVAAALALMAGLAALPSAIAMGQPSLPSLPAPPPQRHMIGAMMGLQQAWRPT